MSHEIQNKTGLKARQLGLRLGVPRTTWQRWQTRAKKGDSLLQKPGPKKLGPLPLAAVGVVLGGYRLLAPAGWRRIGSAIGGRRG